MGELISIILFFVYTWGLGFTATRFIKNAENSWEKNLMRIGIGLGILPLLAVFLNLLHIPLDWKIFLALSLIIPAYSIIKDKKLTFPKPKLKKSTVYILVVLFLFLATFFMYHKGAFSYPYLEDDDPWDHAKGIKYVSIEKNLNTPEYFQGERFFYYMDPYPPGYEAVQGILHQTNDTINWSMKFFNALIISLGIIFFYFFAKELIESRQKALFSTFALAMVPCYLSHFIWAHALIITLFFPAMYCLGRIKYDKKWFFPAALVIGSIALTHPEEPIKLGILFVLFIVTKSLLQKKFLKTEFFAVATGYLLSFMWWAFNWRDMWALKLGRGVGEAGLEAAQKGGFTLIKKILTSIPKIFPTSGGSATRAYSFSDFFMAKSQNLINNPIGVGIFLTLITIVALISIILEYKSLREEKNHWLVIALVWFVFIFIFINSVTFHLPMGLRAFRMWMLLAFSIALLAPQGAFYLARLGKKFNISKSIIIAILIIGVILTSGYQKYSMNTASWFPGGKWTSMEELQGYTWLKTLPPNTRVFDMATKGDKVVIGYDKYSCAWCENVQEFRADILNNDAVSLHEWLKKNKYEYLVIGGMTYKYLERQFGENKTKEILPRLTEDVATSGLFKIEHQNQGVVIFKVL